MIDYSRLVRCSGSKLGARRRRARNVVNVSLPDSVLVRCRWTRFATVRTRWTPGRACRCRRARRLVNRSRGSPGRLRPVRLAVGRVGGCVGRGRSGIARCWGDAYTFPRRADLGRSASDGRPSTPSAGHHRAAERAWGEGAERAVRLWVGMSNSGTLTAWLAAISEGARPVNPLFLSVDLFSSSSSPVIGQRRCSPGRRPRSCATCEPRAGWSP